MIDKPLAAVTAADIQRLVDDGVAEGRTIEFKRELPGMKDSDRKEFLADVSSFANATGGDLVYGVAEKNGTAVAADGLAVPNVDGEVLRLDQMIRSGVSPRLIGLQIQAVPGLANGPAIVIRIPRSWQGPHIVNYQQHFRFFSRNANGKYPMDVSDIRDAVLNAGSVEERIRNFRADRLARVVAGETPLPLDGTRIICVHAVPFASYGGAPSVDLHRAASETSLLRPWRANGWSAPEYNIDGVYTYVPRHDSSITGAYVQLLRNGIVEATESTLIGLHPQYPESLPSLAFARELFGFINRVTQLYKLLEVSPPIAVLVSILGSKGTQLGVSQSLWLSLRPIDRNVLVLPEAIIDDWSVEPEITLKPILDALWQSVGASRCLDYDENGQWIARG